MKKESPVDFDKDFETKASMVSIDEVMIANAVSEDEAAASVVVPERVRQVEGAYKTMLLIIKGKNVDITYELNSPYKSMGSVSITGNEIIVANTELFVKVAEMASNLEVYPKVNGTVQMNFTFHNLTRKEGK